MATGFTFSIYFCIVMCLTFLDFFFFPGAMIIQCLLIVRSFARTVRLESMIIALSAVMTVITVTRNLCQPYHPLHLTHVSVATLTFHFQFHSVTKTKMFVFFSIDQLCSDILWIENKNLATSLWKFLYNIWFCCTLKITQFKNVIFKLISNIFLKVTLWIEMSLLKDRKLYIYFLFFDEILSTINVWIFFHLNFFFYCFLVCHLMRKSTDLK